MSAWIVIPGYNEAKHIPKVIESLKKLGYKNILFVDDGSTDESLHKAEQAGAIVLSHVVNIGKGAAAKTGCDYAVEQGAKIIVLMDADGQHKSKDVPRFIEALKKSKSDIVFGYRIMNSGMPPVMKFGNKLIGIVTVLLDGINLHDTQSGFRCFTARTYKKIRWKSNDYSMESEMISNVAKKKLKFSEIPIQTIYTDKFKGTTIFDGIKIFINIIKFRIFGGAL